MDLRHVDRGAALPGRAPRRRLPPTVANGVIVVGGVIVLALLAWGHLGLGAWIAPPPLTAARQDATAGPYRVALVLDTGQFTPGTRNSASVILRDAAGRAVDGATVRIQPQMKIMVMNMPVETGLAQGGGHYSVHPAFGMAGEWRLDVVIARPGTVEQRTAFDVNVRWQ